MKRCQKPGKIFFYKSVPIFGHSIIVHKGGDTGSVMQNFPGIATLNVCFQLFHTRKLYNYLLQGRIPHLEP